ncbi:MAG: hypothetical protein BZ136_07690, partial [Methanosphaera sp. rholeuAM74]
NNKIKQLEATIKELNKTTTKKTTTTTVTQLKGRVGAITQLKATIKDSNGNPVPDGRVVFKVNGITVKDEAQNTIYAIVNNGTATIKYTIPKSWYKDNTIVEATYGETHNYLSSKGNSTKNNITPGNVKIKIADLPVHENGDKLQFVITATDESGESMTGGVVIMKTNGVTLKDSNGKALQANVVNGVAILDYNITLGARTHNLTAVYAYTGYNRVEAKNTLNVTKGEIFIRYNPVITKTAKTTVTADILDKNKNHMYGNVTVGIRVDGEMVTISDAIEGIINVTLPITFTKGIHSIEFVVGETGAFKSDRLTSIIIKN